MGGIFFVSDMSPCRFDEQMTLKEDYDFTCQHIDQHGSVYRCNRMFVHARHATNAGGAVDARDKQGKKERYNIAILQAKWPGVFRLNGKRKDEVILNWRRHDKFKEAESKKDTAANSSKKKTSVPTRTRSLVITKAKKRVYGSFSPNGKISYTNKL